MTHFMVPKATTTKIPVTYTKISSIYQNIIKSYGEADEHLQHSTHSALNSGKYQFLSLYLPY